MALALMNMDNLPDALEATERALQINPRYTKAWNTKALLLYDMGRLEDALGCWQHSVEIEPVEISRLGMVATLLDLGRPEEAIAVLEQGVWKSAEDFRLRGNALRCVGNYEAAIQALLHAIELDANDAETWSDLAVAFLAINAFEDALQCCDHSLTYF
jgi:superkiller protein 3